MNQELIDFKECVNRRIEDSVLRIDDLRHAESKRIDQIRSIDVAAVAMAKETASTVAQQLTQISAQFNERLALLEKAQYTNTGSSGGHRDMYGWFFGAIVAVLGFGITIYFALHK